MSINSEASAIFQAARRKALEEARKREEETIPLAKEHLRKLIREEIIDSAAKGNKSLDFILNIGTFLYDELGKQTISSLMRQIFQEEEIDFIEEDPEEKWCSGFSTCYYTLSGWGK